MDKIIYNAVAGSGKTTFIIDSLNETDRTAIITYTIANQDLLKSSITKKFGMIPDNIHIFGVWQFLYSFCMVPNLTVKPNGIIFDTKYIREVQQRKRNAYGINRYIFNNMISNFILSRNIDYLERIDKYFDVLYIDEFQDFDSYDFDLIMTLNKLKAKVVLVGDYYQKTFSTSKKGNKGIKKYQKYENYKNEIEKYNFKFDDITFKGSYRCPPIVCDFITNKLKIDMISNNQNFGEIKYITNKIEIKKIMKNNNIKKLFYETHYKYDCNSINWGESKGQTYKDICVVLNPTTLNLYKKDRLDTLKPLTKAKFYVACTRTKSNLIFIDQKSIPKQFII